MDPQIDLPDLVEDLEVNIDELSDALQPLLDTPLHDMASSLPLVEKSKLYVLAAYSIESLLFSALQANGINAKEHAVFSELARLKSYYGKIKEAEERELKPRAKVDVGAAQRFIKHALSGNDKYDLERAERMAKERAKASLKAKQLHKKFDHNGEEIATAAVPRKRSVEEIKNEEAEEEEESEESSPGTPSAKRPPITSSSDSSRSESVPLPPVVTVPKKSKRDKKRNRKNEENAMAGERNEEGAGVNINTAANNKKDRKKKNKKNRRKSGK